jgi:hypothetical protein
MPGLTIIDVAGRKPGGHTLELGAVCGSVRQSCALTQPAL